MHNGLSGYHRQNSHIHPYLDQILANWPEEQKNTIYLLINKYGLPNDACMTKITWYLAQTIDYRVPVQSFGAIAQFDGSLYPDRTAGEATAKCDQEAANFMALNLMNDIVTGKQTAEDARRAAVEIEKAFRLHGQYSPYTTGFLFPKQSNTADPDVAVF
ncbi:hypothetical protein LQV63_31515 [Paenibacillus profundus]|uniref:Uncharacterized protein n=1 Tax=Paenibacillus profundus TaxID=1173085 RepID=A0ABS8YRZ1_9BACL|nr:hypothetical protein [Paenibacillus profundus]MCE5173749.1 hypothetical protein [Paenibacillus profundus]